MGSLGQVRRDENTHIIESEGTDTTVNGQTIKAFWQNAGIVAIQRFMREDEWALAAFDVRLPYYGLNSPYSIKNGTEMTCTDLGWRGVVRNLTPERNDNEVIQLNCLVVEATT